MTSRTSGHTQAHHVELSILQSGRCGDSAVGTIVEVEDRAMQRGVELDALT